MAALILALYVALIGTFVDNEQASYETCESIRAHVLDLGGRYWEDCSITVD